MDRVRSQRASSCLRSQNPGRCVVLDGKEQKHYGYIQGLGVDSRWQPLLLWSIGSLPGRWLWLVLPSFLGSL
jgi:hypothetical protein